MQAAKAAKSLINYKLIQMIGPKCKICRRAGVKLFLKGDKCMSPKCEMVKKPYPPGTKKKRRTRGLSEYGEELKEKQKLKNWYNLREAQFSNYVKKILAKGGKVKNASDLLIRKLESRLDNVIFRLGFAQSRSKARQFVSHGHFLVNNKKVNIPSYEVKKGDIISISVMSAKKRDFANLAVSLKKYAPPAWLALNIEKLEGKVLAAPAIEGTSLPIEISKIFERYSR